MPPSPPTTIREIETRPFLAKRLKGLVYSILLKPQETVLWVGAGLSAKYTNLPTWAEFLRITLNHARPAKSKDPKVIEDRTIINSLIDSGRLAIAAECLEGIVGQRLHDRLRYTFGNPTGSLPSKFLNLHVRDLICTNYDTLLETNLPWYDIVFPSNGIEKLISRENKIIKIHGSVSEPESCVLSLSSYIRAYNVNLQWYLTNTFSTCSVVFIGTSMNPIEPYFRTLEVLSRSGRRLKPHWAIMSVKDESAANSHGKRLAQYGIQLVPYIPDATHSFIDELIEHIHSRSGERKVLMERFARARSELKAGRLLHVAKILSAIPHDRIRNKADRRMFGDIVSQFFISGLTRQNPQALLQQCEKSHIKLTDLLDRYADVIIPNQKTARGLQRAQQLLQEATNTN